MPKSVIIIRFYPNFEATKQAYISMNKSYTPIALLLLLLAGIMPCAAQSYKSLLWTIEGKNLRQPAYLYGTMHSKDMRVHDLSDSVYVAIERCSAMALEIITTPKDQLSLMTKVFMRDTTLQDLYSASDYEKVNNAVLKKMGAMSWLFKTEKIKPLFLVTMLTELAESPADASKQADAPLDSFLQQWGEQNQKKLIGIESIDEQIKALDAIPLKEQAQMLLAYINDEQQSDSLEKTMMRYYLDQDLDSLWLFYQSQKGDGLYNQFDQAIIQKRNKIMALRIDSILQKQPTFIAVGALHLPAQNGLIELLRQKGYILKPVFNRKQTWFGVNSKAIGFEVKFPIQPEVNIIETPDIVPAPNQGKIDTSNMSVMYSGEDLIQNLFYSVVYIPVSDTTMSDEEFYTAMSEKLLLKENTYMVSQDTITVNGMKVFEGELDLSEEMNSYSMRFWLLRHKNRVYMLNVVGDLSNIYAPQTDIFFRSLKIKPEIK